MSPGQFLLHNQDKVDPEQAAARNYTSKAMKLDCIYNMRRELKKRKVDTHGLGANSLANMPDAEQAIADDDKRQRTAASMTSKQCLGIVRKNDWFGGVTTWLYGLNSLIIMGAIAKEGRGIYYMDSTKKGTYGLNSKTE